MSLSIPNMLGGGGGGFFPSVVVKGLSKTDTVRMAGNGKTYIPNLETIEPTESYTELEYIESTGTQYIDTLISDGTNAAYEIVFYPISCNTRYQMYFAGPANPIIPKLYCNNDAGGTAITKLSAGCSAVTKTVTINTTSKNTIKYNSSGTVVINGTSYDVSACAGLGWGSSSWWIFNGHEESNLYSNMRFYSLKMWTDGKLVRDFVPAKRNSDSVIGLYDRASNTFFINSGTGTFTAGSTVGQIEVPTLYNWIFDKVEKLGTYTITASNGTETVTEDVLIDIATNYYVDMSLR